MIRRFAPLLLGFLLLPLRTPAQKSATIAGNVYYESEYQAAKNVVVVLSDGQHVFIESEATSDGGRFRFAGLQRATYHLSVDVPGYESVSFEVDVSMTSDKILSIYLKPISKSPAPNSPHSSSVSAHELSMPSKSMELVDSGKKKLYFDKNAQASVADFQQAIALAPAYYEAHYLLGMAHLTLGDHAAAEKDFRKSIDLSHDTFPEADIGLGATMLDRGNFSDAEKSIRRGLGLNPNLWLGHYELGRALLSQNHLPESLASAEQARVLAPNVPIIYRLLSNIHLLQKNYPALLQDLDTYLSLDPDSPAGLRAKQLRDQIQQKLPDQHLAPASAKP